MQQIPLHTAYHTTNQESVQTHLFVANGRFPGRLLFPLGQGLDLLDGFGLRDGDGEFDVGFGVFVAGLPVYQISVLMVVV